MLMARRRSCASPYTYSVLIGIISDTHQPSDRKTLWDEVHHAFTGVDLILHAGDIIHPIVLDWLQEIAPVLAARGNNDRGLDDTRILDRHFIDHDGRRLAMVHDMEPEDRPLEYLRKTFLKGEHADIMVTGHTHIERIDFRESVLQINPGSATLPHLRSTRLGTVGLLEWGEGKLEARIVRLGETEGLPNPGREFHFTPETGIVRLTPA
jgi:putative phosphoesterase